MKRLPLMPSNLNPAYSKWPVKSLQGKSSGEGYSFCLVGEAGSARCWKEARLLSHVTHGGLAPDSVRKATKAPIGKQTCCKMWTDGTDAVLTFLQGLGHRTDPLEGRFMSDSQVRKLEFTGKHISPFSVGPCVEIPT